MDSRLVGLLTKIDHDGGPNIPVIDLSRIPLTRSDNSFIILYFSVFRYTHNNIPLDDLGDIFDRFRAIFDCFSLLVF